MPRKQRVTTRFELTQSLSPSCQAVYDHLSEPSSYLGLQVLLTSMSEVLVSTNSHGQITKRYSTVETFRCLGLPLYRNRIQVEMTLVEPGRTLVSRVRSAPKLDITATYSFVAEGEGTRLTLSFEILVSTWLAKGVTAEALRVQKLVMAKLKERLG